MGRGPKTFGEIKYIILKKNIVSAILRIKKRGAGKMNKLKDTGKRFSPFIKGLGKKTSNWGVL